MLAFKGFNSKLQATMGNGIFQFEPGKTYEEKECKCAHNGFHCAENPLCALSYYRGMDSRYFLVEAAGDINQDGKGSRISCTRLTLKKEISRTELAACACKYMLDYPDREMESDHAVRDEGRCWEKGDFIIVRGKSPAAAGVEGEPKKPEKTRTEEETEAAAGVEDSGAGIKDSDGTNQHIENQKKIIKERLQAMGFRCDEGDWDGLVEIAKEIITRAESIKNMLEVWDG